MSSSYFSDAEAVLGALARLFAAEGKAREVAILTYSSPNLVETGYDNWNGGRTTYSLFLHAPLNLYSQLQDQIDPLGEAICAKAQVFLQQFPDDHLTEVKIVPAVVEDPGWREKAAAWLSGERVSNQGRVRSDNVAPLSVDGLLFRSPPETHMYRALKARAVSFAPLPVFVRGGDSYRRLEPDFFVVHGGIALVVEVDGDTVHHETPAEAHARTSMLQHEGVHIERVRATECDSPEKAKAAVQRVMDAIEKLRAAR